MDKFEQQRRLRAKTKAIREVATEDEAVNLLDELLGQVARVNQNAAFTVDVSTLSDKELFGMIEQAGIKASDCAKEAQRRIGAHGGLTSLPVQETHSG